MPAPTSLSPLGPTSTSRLSPLAPSPAKIPPLSYTSPSESFAYRRFSASRLSDTRGSLDTEEGETTTNRPQSKDKKEQDSGGGLKPFASERWGPRYGPLWRVSFGSSNERGSGHDEALDDGSPEPREATAVASRPMFRAGSENMNMKAEPESINDNRSKEETSHVEDGYVKPKRRPRASVAKKMKGEGEVDDGPPSAKRRKGV